jgi:hypothetical protein
MFTVPPALLAAGGTDGAAVVGDQLPLVVVGQVNDPEPPAPAPVDDDEEEEQPANAAATVIPAMTAAPTRARRNPTSSTEAPLLTYFFGVVDRASRE